MKSKTKKSNRKGKANAKSTAVTTTETYLPVPIELGQILIRPGEERDEYLDRRANIWLQALDSIAMQEESVRIRLDALKYLLDKVIAPRRQIDIGSTGTPIDMMTPEKLKEYIQTKLIELEGENE